MSDILLGKLKHKAEKCVTHHCACDCREYFYRKQLSQQSQLINKLEDENEKLNDTFFANIANKLAIENEKLIEGLEAIRKHQEVYVSGDIFRNLSTTWSIADKILKQARGE